MEISAEFRISESASVQFLGRMRRVCGWSFDVGYLRDRQKISEGSLMSYEDLNSVRLGCYSWSARSEGKQCFRTLVHCDPLLNVDATLGECGKVACAAERDTIR